MDEEDREIFDEVQSMIKKYVPIIIILVLASGAIFFDLHKLLSFSVLQDNQDAIENFINDKYIISILIYFSVYIVIVGLSIPGATFMTLLGGFVYGHIIGTILVVLAATFGASLLFLSAKTATDGLAKKSGKWVKKMQGGFQDNAFSYLLTLRLIPIFPFVAINLAAAILQIPFRTFFFGTLIGIIPGSFVYVSLGVGLKEIIKQPNFSASVILEPKVLIALTGLGMLSILPIIYKHWKK